MARLCDQLALNPGDHLLEIGTGWGALAEYAARHYGCRVATTTLSREQHRWAAERMYAGLRDRVGGAALRLPRSARRVRQTGVGGDD